MKITTIFSGPFGLPVLLSLFVSLISSTALAADVDLITNIYSNKSAVIGGEAVSYTVTVENRGPGTATDVDWRMGIPAAESFSNENCTVAGGAVCPVAFNAALLNLALGYEAVIPSMPVDSIVTFTFDTVAKTDADDYKAVSLVTVDSADTETKPDTNESDINVSVVRALLSYKVEKTFTQFENAAGSAVVSPNTDDFAVFEVTVTNDGIDDLYGLRYREAIGVDSGNGTVPTVVGSPTYSKPENLSGLSKDYYAEGTTLHGVSCTAATNGAICPTDYVATAQDFSEYITIPLLPGRTRAAVGNPAGNPESSVTFEVKIKIGELVCSTVANSHRTLLTEARLYGPSGTSESDSMGVPYGIGDSSDNLVNVNQNLPAPNCTQYDIVTQLTEPVAQGTDGIDGADTFTYTVTVSNSGPDDVVDLPFYFGLYTDNANNGYIPSEYDSVWSISNSISCVNTGGATCPTGYSISDHGTSSGSPPRAYGLHNLPDAQAVIPNMPNGGSLTFTVTGTAGNLTTCGIPRYVNAHAHAMPGDLISETNVEYPSVGFTSYYSTSGQSRYGYPQSLNANGNYYGNNGFSLRTQWNTGVSCAGKSVVDFDLSTTMTGPFPDDSSTTPIAGPLSPGQLVYYRVRANNLDDGDDTLDFISPTSSNPLTEARATLYVSGGLGYRSSHPDWLDFTTDQSGWGTDVIDLYHPDDVFPSYGALLYEYPALATTPYGEGDAEDNVPWQAYLDVGAQCGDTSGGAVCPDGGIGVYHYPYNTYGMELDGVQGHRSQLGIADDSQWYLEPGYGHTLHLPVGSSMEFVMPFVVPPAKVSCVDGGDLFSYTGSGFEASIYDDVEDADDIDYQERDAANDKSRLTFQVEIPACTGSLEIDKRIVAPATSNILPADGIVRYEVDLTYPATNGGALDVARFTDIPVPGCDGWSAGTTCADADVINVVGCAVISGTAACPSSIPIGQKRAQDGTLSAITAGTIDTRWGTSNAANVSGGAAFEPGSTIRVTLDVEVSNASALLNELSNTAAFASDPESSQYGPGLYAEDTELMSLPKPDSMVLKKSVIPTDAELGETLTYTLEVINNGPADGQGAYIEETLPTKLLAMNPSGYANISCAPITTSPPLLPGPNIADCANVNITNNGTAGFRVDMTGPWSLNSGYRFTFEAVAPREGTSVVNTATLTPPPATSTQRFGTVQDSTANVRTPDAVDLELSKTVFPAIARRGVMVVYTLTLNNTSTVEATGIEVTDVLPPGVTYVSHTAGETFVGNVWTISNLPGGGSKSLDVTVSIN